MAEAQSAEPVKNPECQHEPGSDECLCILTSLCDTCSWWQEQDPFEVEGDEDDGSE